ncbi:glycerate kinase [Actinomadura sp. NBRC 104425]|uniref:glycerate kinase family protein n=1 Tax=Actinomadura sp. NBRC 104425 TaxID=3032204 RepID=UPI0024A31579|nr:glycerate kinase [Actinomadura sp. NBRC 104425]GLZ12209.1 glycerate kinase [Actinomadura sp. NBRC 104425]
MRIVIAAGGFKESLAAEEVAALIARGVHRAAPDASITAIPLPDGGEGTARMLAAASGGRLVPHRGTGPTGTPVDAHYAILGWPGPRTALVEMAAAAGLRLVPPDARDPGRTTTAGVGELIAHALDAGAARILVGCGDSGTSDGGAGALQALGARLLDASGRELPRGGAALARLERIDPSGLDPRLARTELVVACNPFNVLCGPAGVARVYGPQKGATPAQADALDKALCRWACILERDLGPTGIDLRSAPGTGASGGLGAGLAAVGGRLVPRFEVLLAHLDLDGPLAAADLVITAEGAIDRQTSRGKLPGEVARRAKRHGKPVLALAAAIGPDAHLVYGGIDAYACVLPGPMPKVEAMERCAELLADGAERALRMVLLGTGLACAAGHRAPAPVSRARTLGGA